jgi:hypothetical protein
MPTELPPIPPPRKKGRPRRHPKALSVIKSVRVDEHTQAIVESKFTSMGEALFYLASFIHQFRCLPVDLLQESDLLTDVDVELLRSLIHEKLDSHRGDDKSTEYKYLQTLRHLEQLLPSDPGSAGRPRPTYSLGDEGPRVATQGNGKGKA